jgi:hypothetical protein
MTLLNQIIMQQLWLKNKLKMKPTLSQRKLRRKPLLMPTNKLKLKE